MRFWKYIATILMIAAAFTQRLPAGSKAATTLGQNSPLRFESHLSVNSVKYVQIPESTLATACETTNPPQPLTTPSPLIDSWTSTDGLSVSFIIGTDGLVHSAFVLTSAGDARDRAVLKTLSLWRYHPALCNGVPAETEARIHFSTTSRIFGLE